jgi:hypothetical protein
MTGSSPALDPPATPTAAVRQIGSRSSTPIRHTSDSARRFHPYNYRLAAAPSLNTGREVMDELLYGELLNCVVTKIDDM